MGIDSYTEEDGRQFILDQARAVQAGLLAEFPDGVLTDENGLPFVTNSDATRVDLADAISNTAEMIDDGSGYANIVSALAGYLIGKEQA